VNVERSRHSFFSADLDSLPTALLNNSVTADSTVAFSIKNVFGVSLLEGFNKYAKAGLTAYISHQYNRYSLMNMDVTLENPKNVKSLLLRVNRRLALILLSSSSLGSRKRLTGKADHYLRMSKRSQVKLIPWKLFFERVI
jgi:hypothetical protein